MSDGNPPGADQPEKTQATRSVTLEDLNLGASPDSGDTVVGPRAFLFTWFQLFKTAQIHAISNRALLTPAKSFIEMSSQIISREGAVSLQSKDGTLFLNSVKLSLSTEEYYDVAQPIFTFFEDRGIGGFVIEDAFDMERLYELLGILVYAPPTERTYPKIQSKLQAANLPFRVNRSLGVKKSDAGDVVLERRAYTFLTYSKLVVLIRSLLAEKDGIPAKRHYLIKRIARTVESMVDICMEDDHTFLGLASVKSGDAYAPHHAANVAVLSIALGEKLGLGKVDLADLGIAAALTDIGMGDLPQEILEKGDDLEPGERAVLERHPFLSVKFLLEEKQLTRSLLRRILVAFEHHRHVDGGGYPQVSHPIDLFSRIVAIADAYDAFTTDRPGRKASLADEALGMMLAESGEQFDPLLLKVFVNTIGLYPVGTLVRLTTGEIALVVYSGGERERVTHPIVAVLGPDGKPSQTLDLSEKGPSGQYVREIASSEDPAKYGVQPSGLLSNNPA